MNPVRILAISGSLSARSINTALLRAAQTMATGAVEIELLAGLGALPHFNPDDDSVGATLPLPVYTMRAAVARADAVLISSPEYAHGVPGTLKNALDWLVSGPEVPDLPIGLLNASSRAVHAQRSLVETLNTMSAHVVEAAVRVVPLDGRRLSSTEMVADSAISAILGEVLEALVSVARSQRTK